MFKTPEGSARENTVIRRFLIIAAFGFGLYYLWTNNGTTAEMVAIGAMGVAVLLEFAGTD